MGTIYRCADCASELTEHEYEGLGNFPTPLCPECNGRLEKIDNNIKNDYSATNKGQGKILLKICESCNHEFSQRATKCPKCGWAPTAICAICKSIIPFDSKTCPECGDPSPFLSPIESEVSNTTTNHELETVVQGESVSNSQGQEEHTQPLSAVKGICPKCKSMNAPSAVACIKCGTPIRYYAKQKKWGLIIGILSCFLILLFATPWLTQSPTSSSTGSAKSTATRPSQAKTQIVPTDIALEVTNKTPDCAALLADADYLESVYKRVRSLNYKVTKKTCDSVNKEINRHFGADWSELRGVTGGSTEGEPKLMSAARVLGRTCPLIISDFACEGPAKLKQDSGPNIVDDYDRDFRNYIEELRTECRNSTSNHKNNSDLKTMAFIQCKEFVKNRLKSPSSADFPFLDYKVADFGDSTYIVRSYVDATNSFGAEIRTNFTCKIRYMGGVASHIK